jgi:hypothetical protein
MCDLHWIQKTAIRKNRKINCILQKQSAPTLLSNAENHQKHLGKLQSSVKKKKNITDGISRTDHFNHTITEVPDIWRRVPASFATSFFSASSFRPLHPHLSQIFRMRTFKIGSCTVAIERENKQKIANRRIGENHFINKLCCFMVTRDRINESPWYFIGNVYSLFSELMLIDIALVQLLGLVYKTQDCQFQQHGLKHWRITFIRKCIVNNFYKK